MARARCVLRTGPSQRYQPACKPGSVRSTAQTVDVTAIRLGRRLPGASSNLPERLARTDPRTWPRTTPIRSCSRWGLPCRLRCRTRGALLPHRFTLAAGQIRDAARGGLLFCGTVPEARLAVAGANSAGRYPAPFVRGARTFLPTALSGHGGAAVRPTDAIGMGWGTGAVKSAGPAGLPVRCAAAGGRHGSRAAAAA